MKKLNFTITFIPIILIAFLSLMFGFEEAGAQSGRSTGWGWCAKCGQDRGPGHDFTHGADSDAGSYIGRSQQQEEGQQERWWRAEGERSRRTQLAEEERLRQLETTYKKQEETVSIRREGESDLKQKDWEKEKADFISSLKRTDNVSKLKDSGGRLQEDYYKGLKTTDVPLRSSGGRDVSRSELNGEKIKKVRDDFEKKGDRARNLGKRAWEGIVDTRDRFVEWVKLRIFNETFNQVPIVSGLRSAQQKTASWYKGMKELVVGVYKHGMGTFQRGVDELGSERVYTGSDDDPQQIGDKTRERAGKMATSEIEGKGSF